MHELEYARAGVPSTTNRYRGADSSGRVAVEIDTGGQDARMVLEEGWRTEVGVRGLGPAVVEAFTAAATVRLGVWAATAPSSWMPAAARHDPEKHRSLAEEAEALGRAWRDLGEFQIRLAELQGACTTVTDAGRRVRATVRDGRLLAVELDGSWSAAAPDADLVVHVGAALRAALHALHDVPDRALDSCPNLRAVLDHAPLPLPGTAGKGRRR